MRVAPYVRVSTVQQGEGTSPVTQEGEGGSLDAQEDACRRLAESEGLLTGSPEDVPSDLKSGAGPDESELPPTDS